MLQLLTNILPLFFILTSNSVDESNIKVIECGKERVISITLMEGYYHNNQSYEEGKMEIFNYPDSSYVIVFCGQMQSKPLFNEKNYQVEQTENTSLLKSRSGINLESNKYWREDNYAQGLTIAYDNVHKSKKNKFDKILRGATESMK